MAASDAWAGSKRTVAVPWSRSTSTAATPAIFLQRVGDRLPAVLAAHALDAQDFGFHGFSASYRVSGLMSLHPGGLQPGFAGLPFLRGPETRLGVEAPQQAGVGDHRDRAEGHGRPGQDGRSAGPRPPRGCPGRCRPTPRTGFAGSCAWSARLSRMAATMPRRSPLIRVTSAASMATSVPVPMAMPRSAVASAGASLIPSPTIADRPAPAPAGARTTAAFSSGSTSAMTSSSSMPTCRAMASRGAPVVAGQHHHPQAQRLQRRDGLGRVVLDRVGHGEDAGQPAVHGREHRRLALALQALQRRLRAVRRRRRAPASACGCPTSTGRAVHRGPDAVAGDRLKVRPRGQRRAARVPWRRPRRPAPADARSGFRPRPPTPSSSSSSSPARAARRSAAARPG